jgi:hypothetical protein
MPVRRPRGAIALAILTAALAIAVGAFGGRAVASTRPDRSQAVGVPGSSANRDHAAAAPQTPRADRRTIPSRSTVVLIAVIGASGAAALTRRPTPRRRSLWRSLRGLVPLRGPPLVSLT